MNIKNIQRYNFFFELFENGAIPPCYNRISGVPLDYYQKGGVINNMAKKNIVIVNCIPPYLPIDNKNLNESYCCYSKTYRLGFAMDFRGHSSAQEFLRNRLGKKVYKNLRQDIQRLERKHPIRTEFFWGEIDENNCAELMETLKGFICDRFKGRTSKHVVLKRWKFYQDTVYAMILAKKASLFVMYELDQPIAISLHYHYKNILFTSIISFDSRFHKFSMGRQLFVKQIDWCYKNNYQLLDMGWGSYDYKLKFANAVYRLQTQVLYPKKNYVKNLLSLCISRALMLKYYGVLLLDRKFIRPETKFKNRWLKPNSISN